MENEPIKYELTSPNDLYRIAEALEGMSEICRVIENDVIQDFLNPKPYCERILSALGYLSHALAEEMLAIADVRERPS